MMSSVTEERVSKVDATTQKTAHEDLHSEQGAIRGDRPARAGNPVIKVEDLAWLEFEKPDLDAAERFAHDFGLATAYRSEAELHLRGTLPGTQAVIIRRGPRSRFVAPDLPRLLPGGPPAAGPRPPGPTSRSGAARAAARSSSWRTRSGSRCGWWPTWSSCPRLPGTPPLPLNFGEVRRVNTTQRPPRAPGQAERLGHVVLESPSFARPAGLVPGEPRPDRQ